MRLLRLLLLFIAIAVPAAAAPAAGPGDGESHYAGLDDFLVHYKTWGKGPRTVVLIHGFTQSHQTWRAQVPALARKARVIALDLPGHGDSGKPAGTAYSQLLYARAVLAVMDDAKAAKATLVGHSMGLPVILTVLRQRPQAVEGAVFVDGAIAEPTGDAAARKAQEQFVSATGSALKGPNWRLALEQFLAPMMVMAPPAAKRAILERTRSMDQHVVSSTFDGISMPDVWAPGRWDIPVLAIYARMSATGAKEWLSGRFPKARLVVLDGVDHFLHLEQPERINKMIVEFLGK